MSESGERVSYTLSNDDHKILIVRRNNTENKTKQIKTNGFVKIRLTNLHKNFID